MNKYRFDHSGLYVYSEDQQAYVFALRALDRTKRETIRAYEQQEKNNYPDNDECFD